MFHWLIFRSTALVGDLIFLPALLTCKPFGRFFARRRIGVRRDLDAAETPEASETAQNDGAAKTTGEPEPSGAAIS